MPSQCVVDKVCTFQSSPETTWPIGTKIEFPHLVLIAQKAWLIQTFLFLASWIPLVSVVDIQFKQKMYFVHSVQYRSIKYIDDQFENEQNILYI
jgi:hypothetical protein